MKHLGITYKDRKKTPLPKEETVIRILKEEGNDKLEYVCVWKPYNPNVPSSKLLIPAEGYLGTATVILGPHKGIGFHVWEQNNDEFIYYERF